MLKQVVISICFALIFTVLPHHTLNSDLRSFISNSKGLDYKFAGKADSHRFGVELRENKQFHHTITAEDGVRLGCYGFTLEGKKYSTNYIADGKGYRLAPTDTDLITVYSKGSSEAKIASFVESFSEEEIKAANIRYLFPDGCQAPTILYDANNPSSSYENRKKLFESLLEKHQKAKEEEEKNRIIASRALKTDDDCSKNENNGYSYDANNDLRGSNFECCNNERVQLIMPQNDSCSQNVAKLIVPLISDKLSTIPITELMKLHTSTSISFVLRELQYLVQKYDL